MRNNSRIYLKRALSSFFWGTVVLLFGGSDFWAVVTLLMWLWGVVAILISIYFVIRGGRHNVPLPSDPQSDVGLLVRKVGKKLVGKKFNHWEKKVTNYKSKDLFITTTDTIGGVGRLVSMFVIAGMLILIITTTYANITIDQGGDSVSSGMGAIAIMLSFWLFPFSLLGIVSALVTGVVVFFVIDVLVRKHPSWDGFRARRRFFLLWISLYYIEYVFMFDAGVISF